MTAAAPVRLRTAVVLRVAEQSCEVTSGGTVEEIAFAPMFPAPRTERVSPGHRVAVATAAGGREVVVWRWYDAVVLGRADADSVLLWEPAHGEVTARVRASYRDVHPGARAYASAGLPGADWWVAARVPVADAAGAYLGADLGADLDVDLDLGEVAALYTDNDLWAAAFGGAR